MSAIGKIWARLIYRGQKTLDDVPAKYRQDTIDAYYELYGKIIGEE